MVKIKRWSAGVAAGGALVGVLAMAAPAEATTSTSSQAVAFTSLGTLLVTVTPLSLPSQVTAGTDLTSQSVGIITVTDNLGGSTPWSLGVTATDLAGADVTTTPADFVPASDISFTPGTSWGTGSSPTSGLTLNAGTHSFTEPTSDTTPGTTQSPSLGIATGAAGSQGTWYLTGSTISLALPTTLSNNMAYTGTLTYTLAG